MLSGWTSSCVRNHLEPDLSNFRFKFNLSFRVSNCLLFKMPQKYVNTASNFFTCMVKLLQLLGEFITAILGARLGNKVKADLRIFVAKLALVRSGTNLIESSQYAFCCAFGMKRANQSCDRLLFLPGAIPSAGSPRKRNRLSTTLIYRLLFVQYLVEDSAFLSLQQSIHWNLKRKNQIMIEINLLSPQHQNYYTNT